MRNARFGFGTGYATAMIDKKAVKKAVKTMRPPRLRVERMEPEWAEGLRQLYDSVLEEPLPDSFADLLSKLDDTGK